MRNLHIINLYTINTEAIASQHNIDSAKHIVILMSYFDEDFPYVTL